MNTDNPDLPPPSEPRPTTPDSMAASGLNRQTPGAGTPMNTSKKFNPRMLALPVIAIVMIVGWVSNRGTTQADSLKPGDCFVMTTDEEIDRLDTPDCTEPHDSQILAEVTVPLEGGYPSNASGYWDSVFAACNDAIFNNLTRIEELPDDATGDFFSPLERGWDNGDRESLCIITSPSGLDGSFFNG